jgi:hypothetical protein
MRNELLDSLTNHRALNYDRIDYRRPESPNVEVPQPYGLWDLKNRMINGGVAYKAC